MQKRIILFVLLVCSLGTVASAQRILLNAAQKINFNIGLTGGASKLFHNTNFEDNQKLNSLYEFTTFSHDPPESYTWEMFEEDYKMRSSFIQPRFGFTGDLSFKGLPIHIIGEWVSSPSSFENMTTGVTLALGHDFPIGDNIGLSVSVLGGYKFVSDNGWGTPTLVKSFEESRIRETVQEFFNPVDPLGTNKGRLFTLRGGIGKTIGYSENMKIGLEYYGELDATPKIQRQSRMTNMGAMVYLRFNLLGNWSAFDNTFYPNPNGRN